MGGGFVRRRHRVHDAENMVTQNGYLAGILFDYGEILYVLHGIADDGYEVVVAC